MIASLTPLTLVPLAVVLDHRTLSVISEITHKGNLVLSWPGHYVKQWLESEWQTDNPTDSYNYKKNTKAFKGETTGTKIEGSKIFSIK